MHRTKGGAGARQRSHRQPTLRVELLEPRLVLAGDTFLVNFQPATEDAPVRYVVDSGEVFGNRGEGLAYGWSSDHTDQVRVRIDPETGNTFDPDFRLSTLAHFEAGQHWEFELANGTYEVTVAVGDPHNNDGDHTINVEGVNYWTALADTDSPQVATHTVTVSDGRLTIDQGAAADKATRINYVQIVNVPSGPHSPPAVPNITEPAVDGQVTNPFDVHMEAVGYFDVDGDAHKSTDWQIRTVGPGAEPVWETLGIEGVERLHTHLGDGIFLNAQAGQTSLAANTEYELWTRFRDDTGAVSAYDVRTFQTGAASSTFPLETDGLAPISDPTWNDLFGGGIQLPNGTTLVDPGDPIIAIDTDGGSDFPGGESPANAIDGTLEKYLNFGEENSGFILTPSGGSAAITGFRITTANDAEERDPTSWALYGTNDPVTSTQNSTGMAENWELIDSGSVNLPSERDTLGPEVEVDNDTPYTSYRMIFTGVKNAAAANSMQIAEIEFLTDEPIMGTPASLRLESKDGSELLLEIEGSPAAGNAITIPPSLSEHVEVRLVIQAGSGDLTLGQSDLLLTDAHGAPITIYLPSVNLPAGERLDLWVSSTGATYYGTAAQTEPNFALLARAATLDVPFVATQPGFVVEEVGSDYRLPVNITFVPNPGPNPDDPLYYVAELYGSIQVVTRDGSKHTFATGLLDYNPQGPISGSGEQGLSGLAVERDAVDPEIYHLYVGMLWDNGDPAGGAAHYPKVERIDSTAGGLTMASRTVLLNMQPETQGQSHQISNITIGPDGLLYVHNGDGFDATTAQNLNMFRGKILRMNPDGTAPASNPFYDAGDGITARDYVYAYGFRNPFGGAWRASNGQHYTVENGPSVDRLAAVEEGMNYGWDGSNASMLIGAIYNWTPSHAPVNITFVEPETFAGSQFPASYMDRAFVSESGPTYAAGPQSAGKRVVDFALDGSNQLLSGPTTLVEYIGSGRSSVVALAAGPDGLYFSELYEETGAEGPTASGSRIFRVRYVNPLPGDYDINGVVDQNDYLVWKGAFGSNLLLAADGNGDGIVDAADYTVWRNNLGATLPAAASDPHEHDASHHHDEQHDHSHQHQEAPSETTSPTEPVDEAFAGLFFVPTELQEFSSGRPLVERATAPPAASDQALLLLASGPIPGRETEPTGFELDDEHDSDEDEDELFAAWGLEPLQV